MLAIWRAMIQKEWLFFTRQSASLSSLLLYVCTTLVITAFIFREITEPDLLLGLFWLINLFITSQALSWTFFWARPYAMYEYFLYSSSQMYWINSIFNAFFLQTIWIITGGVLHIFGMPIGPIGPWFLLLGLASFSLTCLFGLLSGIAARSEKGFGLTSLLGFPLTIPLLLLCQGIAKKNAQGLEWIVMEQDFVLLGCLGVIIVLLGIFIFPLIWKD